MGCRRFDEFSEYRWRRLLAVSWLKPAGAL
jgi:hypothetical protein